MTLFRMSLLFNIKLTTLSFKVNSSVFDHAEKLNSELNSELFALLLVAGTLLLFIFWIVCSVGLLFGYFLFILRTKWIFLNSASELCTYLREIARFL